MTPFTCVADLARRQHRTISFDQLVEFGFTPDAIRHLVRTDRLWRVHRGVFALEGPLDPIGRMKAAELRCGERSMATLFSAAVLLRLRDHWPSKPQILVANRTGRMGPTGIELHHTTKLSRREVVTWRGIRTTSVPRTIVDCARHLDAKALKAMLRQAEYHHGTDLRVLDVPGTPKTLKRLLDVYVLGSGLTESELEAAFYELCATAGIPLPAKQVHVDAHRVDFIWDDIRLIAETDGRSAHDRSIAYTDDRRRDRQLVLEGWAVLRFTWAEIEHEPALVIGQLRQAVAGAATMVR